MFSRSLIVLLLAASVAGFDYFVSREDGRGVCVSNERRWGSLGKDLVPFFDLENGVLPEEGEENWIEDWQLRHLKIDTRSSFNIYLNHRIVTTNGSEPFKRIVKGDAGPNLLLLASEATLVWSENEDWREGRSFRVHLNQLETGNKSNWAEFCTDLSTEPEKCERLETLEQTTGGKDVLFEGRRWSFLELWWEGQNLTLSTENRRFLLKWRLKNIGGFNPKFLSARTKSTRGVFFVSLFTKVEPIQSENELSRTFSVGPGGNLCLDIEVLYPNGLWGRFELLDLSGQVEKGHLVAEYSRTRLNFTLGQGDFKLRLLDVTKTIRHIGACADNFKIWSPSNGCYVYEGYGAFSEQPTEKLCSTQLNASLSVELTQEQMLKVCKALKVEPGSKALRFYSKWGAAFKECPSH